MAQWKSLGASLGAGSVIAVLMSSTAQADVTAQQVWQSWKDFSTSMGQTITAGSEEMAGDTLTVSNVAMATETPTGGMEGSIEQVIFKELGDGTVEVTMSPEMPINVTTKVEGKDPVEVELTLKQTGLKMLVSGSDAEMSHAMSADNLIAVLGSVSGVPDDAAMDVSLDLAGIKGTYLVKTAAMKQIDSDFTASSLSFNVAVTDPAKSGDFKMTGLMEGIATKSGGMMPLSVDFTDFPAALAAGFATKGGLTYAKASYNLDFKDATSSGKAVSSDESGGFDFAMDANAMSYTATSANLDVAVSSSDMPFPELKVKMAELAFGMMMPLVQSAEPKDFSFLTKIVGLTISDEIWGMFDPAKVLPRDPATLIVDVAGKANWLIDIFKQDPANPTTEVPGQIHALTIKQVQLTAGGADISATGDFTFDNNDLTTYEGMAKPVGTLDARVVGANGLIDKLIQMGLLPEDQAMGGRMMLGMFAKAVEGQQDTLASKIEMKDDGSIFANGQQIK